VTLAILCSGQGLQHADMFRLTGEESSASFLFSHAEKLLGQDPRLFARTAGEAMFENRAGQVLCTVQSLAVHAVLEQALQGSRVIAGYSVGEIAAWSIAGLFQPIQALDLIATRAEAMNAAGGSDDGLLFVRGLRFKAIEALCSKHDLEIAIVNPADAFVLGGTGDHLVAAAEEANRLGAERVVRLAVKVASHTKILAQASAQFREVLRQTHLRDFAPDVRLLSGVDGAPVLNKERGLDKLAAQISQTVQWADCLLSCVESGTTAFLELGPGRALAEIASAAHPHIPARSVEDFKTIDGLRQWLTSHGS